MRTITMLLAAATAGFGVCSYAARGYVDVGVLCALASLILAVSGSVSRTKQPLSSGLRRMRRAQREIKRSERQAQREYEQPGEWS